MKNPLVLLIALVIVLFLAGYMVFYQVRYDEVVILTTFGRATDQSIYKTRQWPYLKWPWPIQGVTRYKTRLRVLEDQLNEIQTADGYAVITKTYVAWRVNGDDPLSFFRRYKSVKLAQDQLNSQVRNVKGVISQHKFEQLVNTDPDKLELTQIEQAMGDTLAKHFAPEGLQIVQVGIRRIELPENVTEGVFENMKKTRERLAAETRDRGDATASSIKSRAESIKDRILAFAEGRAKEIEALGEKEAMDIMVKFKKDEKFASFLFQIDAVERMFQGGGTTTWITTEKDLMNPDLPAGLR